MGILLGTFSFLFGLCAGSFINVVVLRHHTGKGLSGRSRCLSCGHELSWRELIPVVSFFLQQKRCRYCGSAISAQYVLVELAGGLLFLGLYLSLGFSVSGVSVFLFFLYAVILSVLLAIVVYDFHHRIIPDLLVYLFAALALAAMAVDRSWFLDFAVSFLDLAAGPLVALPIALLWGVSGGRWMGLGDAKLSLGIGWLLGLSGGLSALLLSFWIGAVVSVGLIVFSYSTARLWHGGKALTMKSEVPFAPFLVLGTLAVFFFGFDVFGIPYVFWQ